MRVESELKDSQRRLTTALKKKGGGGPRSKRAGRRRYHHHLARLVASTLVLGGFAYLVAVHILVLTYLRDNRGVIHYCNPVVMIRSNFYCYSTAWKGSFERLCVCVCSMVVVRFVHPQRGQGSFGNWEPIIIDDRSPRGVLERSFRPRRSLSEARSPLGPVPTEVSTFH